MLFSSCFRYHCYLVTKKSLLVDINKVRPMINLKEISFGQLCSVPEVHHQLDYHNIAVFDNFNGTKLRLLNLFSNCSPGAYFVQFNVDPSADLTHHAVAVHVKQQ